MVIEMRVLFCAILALYIQSGTNIISPLRAEIKLGKERELIDLIHSQWRKDSSQDPGEKFDLFIKPHLGIENILRFISDEETVKKVLSKDRDINTEIFLKFLKNRFKCGVKRYMNFVNFSIVDTRRTRSEKIQSVEIITSIRRQNRAPTEVVWLFSELISGSDNVWLVDIIAEGVSQRRVLRDEVISASSKEEYGQNIMNLFREKANETIQCSD